MLPDFTLYQYSYLNYIDPLLWIMSDTRSVYI